MQTDDGRVVYININRSVLTCHIYRCVGTVERDFNSPQYAIQVISSHVRLASITSLQNADRTRAKCWRLCAQRAAFAENMHAIFDDNENVITMMGIFTQMVVGSVISISI